MDDDEVYDEDEGMTVADVLETLDDDQRLAVAALIEEISGDVDDEDEDYDDDEYDVDEDDDYEEDAEHGDSGGDTLMHSNIFEGDALRNVVLGSLTRRRSRSSPRLVCPV